MLCYRTAYKISCVYKTPTYFLKDVFKNLKKKVLADCVSVDIEGTLSLRRGLHYCTKHRGLLYKGWIAKVRILTVFKPIILTEYFFKIKRALN